MLRRRKWRADGHRRQHLGDLRAGEHRFDALHGFRGTRVDRDDASVSNIAALEDDVLHPDQRDVVDVGAASLDQAWIFAAFDALADELWQYWGSRGHAYPFLAAF